jgi:asparagine synthase (glutamine-hydrolysing)
MNRPKMGFSIPLANWLSGDLKFYVDVYLSKEKIIKQGLFDFNVIEIYKKAFLSGQKELYSKIWILIVFQMWYEKWMK